MLAIYIYIRLELTSKGEAGSITMCQESLVEVGHNILSLLPENSEKIENFIENFFFEMKI